ncbi:MAG: radical SAM protein [Magnetococcales bacterium]|nr:radical SAM protein [Magnetococcales bacterium]
MAEKVDVLLINPGDTRQIYQSLGDQLSAIEPPVYAGLFAGYLRHKGLTAAIYDTPALLSSAEEAARAACTDFQATLIVMPVYGFQPSASTQNMGSAGRIARLIKEQDPDRKILMTGTHPAALPRQTLEEEAVDFVCDGEGPHTILGVVQALRSGATDFANVPALWWRDGQKIVPSRGPAPLIQDLDQEMPEMAWDLLPMERYRAHNWHCFGHSNGRTPYASLYTSLGCPFSCNFCCINAPFGKPSYRMWSPHKVVGWIDHLVEHYGVHNIKFVDEMFLLNKRHVGTLCDLLLQRDYTVNIWAYARVDTIYDELLEKLHAAGCNWLALGIESADSTVRDGAHKSMGNSEITQAVQRIQKAGIHVLGNYMFGLPDDTPARMQDTLDLATELNCEFANFYSAMAYPGSQLYQTALQEKRALPKEWSHFSQHAYATMPLANQHCTSAEILAFRDKAWHSYFTNPRYLEMVLGKFGPQVVTEIQQMTRLQLPRQLLEQPVP